MGGQNEASFLEQLHFMATLFRDLPTVHINSANLMSSIQQNYILAK